MSSKNALTHGLAARTPRDEADVADRDRRIAALEEVVAPRCAYERGMVARPASALQRRERADHRESRSVELALPIGPRSAGAILTLDARCRRGFEAIDRDRAGAVREIATGHGQRAARRRVEGIGGAIPLYETNREADFPELDQGVGRGRSGRRGRSGAAAAGGSNRQPQLGEAAL